MIRTAAPGMERELRCLWQTCFGEPARPVNLYLRNVFRPENCLVSLCGDRVASALHLLPCRIQLLDGKTAPAHYVYAVATFPEFRGRGLVLELLHEAERYGASRGERYSAVLPANEGLIALYAKAGYQPFYTVRQQTVSAGSLGEMAAAPNPGRRLASYDALCRARARFLARRPGSVLWNEKAFFYAVESARLYGGKLLVSGEGETLSWALCGMTGDCCDVVEWMAHPKVRAELFGLLLREFPASEYRFRLPADEAPLVPALPFQTHPFGMIKPLEGAELPQVDSVFPPYLGLSLE